MRVSLGEVGKSIRHSHPCSNVYPFSAVICKRTLGNGSAERYQGKTPSLDKFTLFHCSLSLSVRKYHGVRI